VSTLRVDRSQVLAFRARASRLDRKLARGSLADAASGGLQDSAPRAAVISLHARVEDVDPSCWEDPSLVQIWGPRAADYVVPRADVDAFTVGRLPRDPDQHARLADIADDVHRVLDGRTLESRDVSKALPELGHLVRLSAITGRVHIRWDASKIWLIGVDAPEADAETARLDLARRFLRWFAPVTMQRFAWWAGIEPADAAATWKALRDELVGVELDGETRDVLRSDEDELTTATGVSGVRLIPHGDPLLKIDGELVVADPDRRLEVFPRSDRKPAFWPVSGGVLVDGEVVGSWARQQRRVTVHPWLPLDDQIRSAIEQEALAIPIASRSKASARWA